MEEIYLHSLPIKEYQIVDWFLPKLKDEVMKVRFLPFLKMFLRCLRHGENWSIGMTMHLSI